MSQRATTWPYRRASRRRVSVTPWSLDGKPIEEFLPSWDPQTDLVLTRQVQVDVDRLREDTGLGPEIPIRLATAWWSSGTTLRGVGTTFDLPAAGTFRGGLTVSLRGPELRSELRLDTVLILAATCEKRPVTAWMAGTVLWEESRTLRLEGGAGRFPIQDASFSAMRSPDFPPYAAWRLEWNADDLELPVLGSVVLFVNRDHPAISTMIAKPDEPTSHVIMAAMQFEVARALIEGAIQHDALADPRHLWPPDSVGKVIRTLLETRFGGLSVPALRQLREDAPGRFAALLQDRLGLFATEPR